MPRTVPLVARAADAVLFRLPGRPVTAAMFVADATRLAAALPPAGNAINVCTDRYAFALGFTAAVLRGHCSLLSSDRSPARLQALAREFPGSYVIDDALAALPPDDDAPSPPVPAIPADRLAAIVFTSGSTGEPVGHPKLWGALAERSAAAAAAFAIDPADPASLVATVPPQHMYGFETTVLWPLHAAVSVWCGPVFFPADSRAALAACPPPRLLVTTPLQLRGLLEGTALAVARVISATAPLDPALATAAEHAWNTEVWEIFGATEVGSIACRRNSAGPEWTLYPGVSLRPHAERVWVDAPDAPPTPLDDALEMLSDGRFKLLARRSDLVKLAGRRASLAGLNRILLAIDGVQDGVFVPPAAEGHHAARMTAFVVAPGRAADAILADLRTRIDPVFLPRRLVQVDRLPRNELGKLPMQALDALR